MISFKKIVLDASKDGVAIAQSILAKSANRTSRPGQVSVLARIMLEGRWKGEGSNVMTFDDRGHLRAGEHRIRAFIVAAGVNPKLKIHIWARYGVPEDQAYASQCNEVPFTAGDALEFCGEDKTNGGIIKLVESRGYSWCKYVHEDVVDAAKRYGEIIKLIKERIKARKKIKTAPVIAALVRGILSTGKREEVLRFCDVMSEGQVKTGAEKWAIRLSQVLSEEKVRKQKEVLRSYQRTEAALAAYLDGKSCNVEKVRPASRELFLLKNEKDAKATDNTPRFLISLHRSGISNEELVKRILTEKQVSLYGLIHRRIPSGSKVVVAVSSGKGASGRLPDRKIALFGTVNGQGSGNDGVSVLKLLNAERIDPNKPIGTEKLIKMSISKGSLPDWNLLSKKPIPITAGDMALLLK